MTNPTITALTKTFMNRTFRVVNNYETGLEEGDEYRVLSCQGKDVDNDPFFNVAGSDDVCLLLRWLTDDTILQEVL